MEYHFGRKTFVPESRNHAGLWLIDGVRSTSSAEVFDTSVLSWGLSLTMSLVYRVASWLAREIETYPKRELRRSGWTPVSAFIRTRSAVRP
jgi:hypothetical protein